MKSFTIFALALFFVNSVYSLVFHRYKSNANGQQALGKRPHLVSLWTENGERVLSINFNNLPLGNVGRVIHVIRKVSRISRLEFYHDFLHTESLEKTAAVLEELCELKRIDQISLHFGGVPTCEKVKILFYRKIKKMRIRPHSKYEALASICTAWFNNTGPCFGLKFHSYRSRSTSSE